MHAILLLATMLAVPSDAELVRVFYMPEDKVFILVANRAFCQKGETEFVCIKRITDRFCPRDSGGRCIASDIIDNSTLPPRAKRDKWRGRGGRVWVDETVVTAAEELSAAEKELDDELAKPSPDPVKALKLQRKLEKLKQSPRIPRL